MLTKMNQLKAKKKVTKNGKKIILEGLRMWEFKAQENTVFSSIETFLSIIFTVSFLKIPKQKC
jgi:hypothetical protein